MKGRKLIVRHRGSVGSTCRVLYFLEYNVLLDKSRVATADVQGDPILKDSSFYRRILEILKVFADECDRERVYVALLSVRWILPTKPG
jgi:hypothetical protein